MKLSTSLVTLFLLFTSVSAVPVTPGRGTNGVNRATTARTTARTTTTGRTTTTSRTTTSTSTTSRSTTTSSSSSSSSSSTGKSSASSSVTSSASRSSASISGSKSASASITASSGSSSLSASASGSATLSSSASLPSESASTNGTEPISCPVKKAQAERRYSIHFNSREVSTTQYHATCLDEDRDVWPLLKSAMDSKKFSMVQRRWPDEFTWSGGFYLNPDKENAIRYARVFTGQGCKKPGVLKFTLNPSGLDVLDVGRAPAEATAKQRTEQGVFRKAQADLGTAIKTALSATDLPENLLNDPDAGLSEDVINGLEGANKEAFEKIKGKDIVMGYAPSKSDQIKIAQLREKIAGPAPQTLVQVVIRTKKAMDNLVYDELVPVPAYTEDGCE